jgi:hypothetical protein
MRNVRRIVLFALVSTLLAVGCKLISDSPAADTGIKPPTGGTPSGGGGRYGL